MESSSLELKVMSCKDLKAFNFFQKLTVYALVSIVSDDPDKKLEQKQQHRTPTDKEGDGNPEWNHEMRFDLKGVSFHDCDHLFIHFELRHEGVMFGDKNIGEVRVPCKDLIQESDGGFKFVNYEVRTSDGKPNGVLTFSYRVNGKVPALGTNSALSEITGYTIAHHHSQTSETLYPPLDVHSSTPQIHSVLPQTTEILYPPLEVHNSTPQLNYPIFSSPTIPQDVQYLSPVNQHSSQENYYLPPEVYYSPPPPLPPPPPPPPPPPFTHPHLPPPPPSMGHGAFYPPPHPSQFHPWAHEPRMFHNHSMPGGWGSSAGHLPGYENGGTSSNHFPDWRDRHSSSWNGR